MRKKTERVLRYTIFTLESHPALVALIDYVAQAPGIESGNYGNWHDYRKEANHVSRQWRKIHELIHIASYLRITDAEVIEESQYAYSGRYQWDGKQWDYCTGQYFPTEYRSAVISILNNLIHKEERKCK